MDDFVYSGLVNLNFINYDHIFRLSINNFTLNAHGCLLGSIFNRHKDAEAEVDTEEDAEEEESTFTFNGFLIAI